MSERAVPTSTAKPGQLVAMISSTVLDLEDHRQAAKDACHRAGVFPECMERLTSRDASAVAVSLEMVDRADIYIGIFASRYGWVPDGAPVSVTEMEFDRAVERKKAGHLREILIFTAHPDHAFTPRQMEPHDAGREKLDVFKNRACDGRQREEFTSYGHLQRLITEAVYQFLLRDHPREAVITDPQHWAKLQKQGVASDQQPQSESFHSLDHAAVTDFLSKLRVQKQEDYLPGLKPVEQFRRFQFLADHDHVRTGAYLCFAEAPEVLLPGAVTKCFHWKGRTESDGFLEDREFRAGLLSQFQGALAFLKKVLRLQRRITAAGRVEMLEIPADVLEEAVANALVHRDYQSGHSGVKISVFEDRVEITSPGLLLPPLSLQNIRQTSVSNPRNPQIARIFYLSGIVERAASGVKRMDKAMAAAGLPPPRYEETSDACFKLTLLRPKEMPADEGFDQPESKPVTFMDHLFETLWYFVFSVGHALMLLGVGVCAGLVLKWAHGAIPLTLLSDERAAQWLASSGRFYSDVFQWGALIFFCAAIASAIYHAGKSLSHKVKHLPRPVRATAPNQNPLRLFWISGLTSVALAASMCLLSLLMNIVAVFALVLIPGAPPKVVQVCSAAIFGLEIVLLAAGLFLAVLNYTRLARQQR